MPDQLLVVDRPPRIQPDLPVDTIKIPAPPPRDAQGTRRLLQLGLPLITVIGFAAISLSAGGSRGPLVAVVMALAVLAASCVGLFTYLQDKKKQAALERAYAARLVDMNKEMLLSHEQQRRFYTYNYPDVSSTFAVPGIARLETEREDRTLRTSTRLWERRPSDTDFGVVRLGVGAQPSSVVYEAEEGEGGDEALIRMATKLQEDSRYVSDIPVTISLRPEVERIVSEGDEPERPEEEAAAEQEAQVRPRTHSIGIAGGREAVYQYARALAAHYVVFHAPMDAKLYVLGYASDEWLWTEDLPHCKGTENQSLALILEEPNEGDEGTVTAAVTKFLEGLRKLLSQRQMRLRDNEARERGDNPTLPFCLLMVDLMEPQPGTTSPLRELESDAAISLILKEGAALGAAVVFLAPERSKIPSDCEAIVEIESTFRPTNSLVNAGSAVHFRYAQTGVNTFRFFGAADVVGSADQVGRLARELARLDVRRAFGADLPGRVPFMVLTGCESMADLLALARANWLSSREAEDSGWLRATLGMMGGGKPRTLVFSAREDGVHGMIAGSTGSGKSELLISLIAMLALNYDPSALNFVLVDYKGGGAFAEFRELPHCVDVITNLGSGGVTRMFAAIQAELRRRQRLLAESGTKDIIDYRQKNLHETREPYPFLFIIIDEFAELIADRSEFKAELESITRVGRALGVSLVLAAQRPSGVTDQMRSNIKLRISLRVESEGESREILRRTDAAYLPGSIPGRGFLQIGTDDIEPIQVAYAGDPYIEPSSRPPVLWPDRPSSQRSSEHDRPQLYKAVIGALGGLAAETGVPVQHAPWPDPLPSELSLSDVLLSDVPNARAITSETYFDRQAMDALLLGTRRVPSVSLNPAINRWVDEGYGWVEPLDWQRHAFRPVVGLVDNPAAAQQAPLVVNLVRGHAAVFGGSGWGKTTFIRSLVVSLAATHTPGAVRFFVLDLGGRSLSALKSLPHVEAVVSPDEESYKEQVEQLLRELEDTLTRRKGILGTSGFSDIREYNAANVDAPLAGLVFIIDNFVEFKETFGERRDTNVESILDRYVALAREGRPYGIYLVVTASQMNALSGQLYNVFTERFALKLADPTEYRALVGGSVEEPGDIPGRGYANADRQPLGFQVALPVDAGNSTQNRELERLAASMVALIEREGRHYEPVIAVGSLPKSVLFRQILSRAYGLPLDAGLRSHLRSLMAEHWEVSREPSKSDWLQVPIGLLPGSRGVRTLQLEARRDGAHGLVAGGTGSGKSELLMTLIVGLAINYAPDILNFVLVDYKGGGAFKPFEALPHCVDIVTNLNKAAVERMFTAIGAEVARRQALNAETNTKDIVEYRKKGLHLTREPYPHLFVIIDEYAEMISDSPEFRASLESITRTGRAQGVTLILASQRPTGVTDQMRANIKLRMSLRVEDAVTSREVLGRSDAASLPNNQPGRGYLQVGNDNIELIQVAWTGDSSPDLQVGEQTEAPKFYDVVVDLCRDLAGGQRPLSPWPPVLPQVLTFSDALEAAYLEPDTLLPAGVGQDTVLNPAIQQWAAGQGEWRDVDWDSQAMRAIVGLVDDPYRARQLPLVVDFTRGHGVIFGASGWGKTTFVRSLITSLAATHRPSEFQAHVLDLGGRGLDALRELPHVGSMIIPDERGYEERVQQLLRKLNELVDRRKEDFARRRVASLAEYNQAVEPADRLPAVLVAIDNMSEFLETFGDLKAGANSLVDTLVALIRQSKPYGVHFLITAASLNVITSRMFSLFTERLTLRLSSQEDYASIVGSRVGEIDEIAGRGYVRERRRALALQVALVGVRNEQGHLVGESEGVIRIGEQMRRQLGDAGLPAMFRIEALPNSLSYRQMLADRLGFRTDEPFVGQLKSAVEQEWDRNLHADGPEWLRVLIGNASGGGPRELRLEAKYDGVHGLVAGGTGSGKSELLMTLIVSMALKYPPDLLNFVLVDYKGGGAFKQFERLPHCVDIVTNLNKAAVERMFTSIGAEVARRQALNADTSTKDIIDYRAKGLHLTREPYPHLFVIIDEYAEMISDNPDHKDKLESLTRVGRAQGVNLLLASQRPKGVSDQMRANIKLRICLRVEETDTSLEMLRRQDAAFLPGVPGRGYLQAGNEGIELIQVAYTGETQVDDRPALVLWPDRPVRADTGLTDAKPNLNDTVVMVTSELRLGKPTRQPWPSFLPERVSLQSAIYDGHRNQWFTLTTSVTDWLNGETTALWKGIDWQQEAMQAVVGLIDDPVAANQPPLVLDLKQHVAAFGDTGWGKTSFLRTLMTTLSATHTPAELHMYVLDLGGRNFRALEGLPHCGAVIYADDETFEERMQRLLERLTDLVDERQQLFSREGVNGLYEYNQQFPDRRVPAVLVVIDNVAMLRENYEMMVENTIIPLVRRSLASGITFAVSSNGPGGMPSKLLTLFGTQFTFKQNDPDKYIDIVGRGAVEFGDIAGRGYVRMDRRPLELQIALPVGIFSEPEGDYRREAEELGLLTANMRAEWERRGVAEGTAPAEIPVLENRPLEAVVEEARPPRRKRIESILGVNSDLQPALFDLKRQAPHFIIAGPSRSGRTTVLYNWALSLAERYPPDRVGLILVDLPRKFVEYGGKHRLDELPHVLATAFELVELDEAVKKLKEIGPTLATSDPSRELFILIDNFDDTAAELEGSPTARELSQVVRRFDREGMHCIIVGGASSSGFELQRRIRNAGYGVGLRTAESVGALNAARTPTAFRGGAELPLGRGYVVRSGQTTMIQVADPYAAGQIAVAPNGFAHALVPNGSDSEDDDDPEDATAIALDAWIERLRAKYAGCEPGWFEAAATETVPPDGPIPPPNPRLARMGELAIRARRWESTLIETKPEVEPVLQSRIDAFQPQTWHDEGALLDVLRAALHCSLSTMLGDAGAADLLRSMNPDDVMNQLDSLLPKEEANGVVI